MFYRFGEIRTAAVRSSNRRDRIHYLSALTYPVSGRSIRTRYDSAGRPDCVWSGTAADCPGAASSYVSSINYAPHGGITSMTLGNGLVTSTAYNTRLQPTSIQAGSLMTLGFDYGTANNNGNVLTQTITRGAQTWTQTYQYDGVNRLTTASESGAGSWTQYNCYDPVGNRWVRTDTTGLPPMTLDTPHKEAL